MPSGPAWLLSTTHARAGIGSVAALSSSRRAVRTTSHRSGTWGARSSVASSATSCHRATVRPSGSSQCSASPVVAGREGRRLDGWQPFRTGVAARGDRPGGGPSVVVVDHQCLDLDRHQDGQSELLHHQSSSVWRVHEVLGSGGGDHSGWRSHLDRRLPARAWTRRARPSGRRPSGPGSPCRARGRHLARSPARSVRAPVALASRTPGAPSWLRSRAVTPKVRDCSPVCPSG